jgi:hypothetical protein
MGPGPFKLGKLTSFWEKLGKPTFRGEKNSINFAFLEFCY